MGCQPVQGPVPTSRTVVVSGAQPNTDPAARPDEIEGAIHSDACAARLQDISGALLGYYAINNRLPATLAELNGLSDLDRPLAFTSPASGRPFTYVPAGLRSPADPRLIVLFDPAVDRQGLRWVIKLRRPRGRDAAATWVERIPNFSFQTYVPPPQIGGG